MFGAMQLATMENSALCQLIRLSKFARYGHTVAKEKGNSLAAHKPVLSRLPNGILVASVENNSPVSRIAIVARAGPRYESSDLVGASHFLRRVIGLVGTKQFSAYGLTRSVQQMGASVTSVTSREHLLVGVDVIRDFAEDAAERLASSVTDVQLHRHWEVEEALKYVEADQVAFEQHLEARLIEALHDAAYRSGLRRSLVAAPYRTRENYELHEFIEAYHHRVFATPSNVALVAIGVSHSDAEAFASKLHLHGGADGDRGKSAANKALPAVTKDAPKFGGGERRVDTGDDVAHAALVCESAGYTDLRGSLAFAILAKAVGGNQSVYRESNTATNRLGAALARSGLRESHYIAPLLLQHSDSGLFGFYVQASEKEIGTAVRTGRSAFLQALKSGISAEDLKRAKTQLLVELALGSESTNAVLEQAAASVLESGKLPPSGIELAADIDRLTLDEVNAAARRALGGKPAYAVVGGLEHAPTLDEL